MQTGNRLTIALPKGRLLTKCLELLQSAGIDTGNVSEDSRKLIFSLADNGTRFVLMRPTDVPVYVEQGAADLGITGKDVLLESRLDVYELLDLRFGVCRFVLAAPAAMQDPVSWPATPRVATKFPRIAGDYLQNRSISARLIKVHGATELAPNVGMADMIVDIVSTGKTLAENNLVVLDEIMQSSARLIGNRASLPLKNARIKPILAALDALINGRER